MTPFDHRDDPCSHCGTCMSFCVWDRFQKDNPGQPGSPDLCRDCMLCYNICARAHPAEAYSDPSLFEGATAHPLLGRYRAAWSGTAVEKPSLGQDGGVTTVLLQAMLKEGMIDAAVVVDRDHHWNPRATVARSAEEIAAVAGSKYTTAPGMSDLAEALATSERVALVCLPCQSTPVRHMMRRGTRYSPEKIVALLGLFCYETFRYDGVRALVEDGFAVPMETVTRFDIKKNRLIFFQEGSPEALGNAPLAGLQQYTWPECLVCPDFSAELADVSLGAVGSRAGENTILVRTPRGAEIVEAALRLGLLSLEEWRNPGIVERICENKRKRRADLSPEDSRFLLKQTLRGNFKKLQLKGLW